MKNEGTYVTEIVYKPNLNEILKRVARFKKDIYFKKMCDISDFSVWFVHGDFVRRVICEDFVNYGQALHFKFIPQNEFWLDIENIPGEAQFYIEHLLVEHRAMKKGIRYEEAFKRAEIAETKERNRSIIARELKKFKDNKEELIKRVHKKLIKSYSSKIDVWIVSGELVRDFFDINYGGGSHDKVDSFTPKNEVWIDDDISQKERKFILLHELHERRMMATKNLSYLEAHRLATQIEDFYRKNPENIDKALKFESESQPV